MDTEPKNVRRGQIYTLVTHRPGDKVRDEVSIFVGYPFKEGSTVKVTIAGKGFTLFTDADSAWNYDARRRPEHGQGHDQGQRHDRRRPVQAGDPDHGTGIP